MKGHEIISHVVRAKMPDREQVRENCVRQASPREPRARHPFLRAAAMLATAAVVVICFLFGNAALDPQIDNVFSVKAYALEQQSDGSFRLRDYGITAEGIEITLSSLDADEGYFYRGIHLDIEGENLKDVGFFVDGDGRFLRAYCETENGELVFDHYEEYYDDDGNVAGSCRGFTISSTELLGNSFTLDDVGSLTEGSILFVGRPSLNGAYIDPLDLTIRAVATFNDGTTQEETLVVN